MAEPAHPRRSRPEGAVFADWRAPDGWPCRRMDWLQPEGRPVRGSLLFAGGRGDFIEKYIEPYRDWHAAGWNVTAFDWRGQGASRGDIVGGNFDSFDPLVADLDALVADWRAATPPPHVAVAHSMGGHLLLRTIVEKRPPLDAAVLVAPMIRVNSRPIPAWAAPAVAGLLCRLGLSGRPMWKTPKSLLPEGASRQRFLTGSIERYEDEAWWWRQEPGFSLGLPSWGWLRAAYRSAAAWFTRDKLAAVELPILILAAERDRLVGADAIREAARRLPNAELVMFPDAAHEILREADPVRLAAMARIDSFLAEHAR